MAETVPACQSVNLAIGSDRAGLLVVPRRQGLTEAFIEIAVVEISTGSMARPAKRQLDDNIGKSPEAAMIEVQANKIARHGARELAGSVLNEENANGSDSCLGGWRKPLQATETRDFLGLEIFG